MNIEEAITYIKEKIKNKLPEYTETVIDGKTYRMNVLQLETKWTKKTAEAIETLLTAYEKEKGENKKWKDYVVNDLENQITERNNKIFKLEAELEKEKEKNKNAYRKANNYLYFNDSADYEVALWEVIRTLRPDLAEKWDNGEDAVLEYIEEE